eukprot:gene10869-21253_t
MATAAPDELVLHTPSNWTRLAGAGFAADCPRRTRHARFVQAVARKAAETCGKPD